jgi:hypothetical protein
MGGSRGGLVSISAGSFFDQTAEGVEGAAEEEEAVKR